MSTEVLAEARRVWVVATALAVEWRAAQPLCQGRVVVPKRAKATGGTAASLGLWALAAGPANANGRERSFAREAIAAFSRAHQLLPAFSRH